MCANLIEKEKKVFCSFEVFFSLFLLAVLSDRSSDSRSRKACSSIPGRVWFCIGMLVCVCDTRGFVEIVKDDIGKKVKERH